VIKRWLIFFLLALLVSIIPLRLALTVYQVGEPQAIVILGGDLERFPQGVKFAQQHPNLEVWVSCGQRQCRAIKRVLAKTDMDLDRVYYDTCPVDTVTNFTCTLKPLLERKIKYVYLLTSDYHLPRSVAIAFLVFGSRGLAFKPVSLPSTHPRSESGLVIVRDFLRSFFWLVTGKTGARLGLGR
jgi:uncharacterized SAM-binding protein YcdF (DUF218 family)